MEETKPEGAPPNTFVEGRNHCSVCSHHAKTHGITDLVTGVCETDFRISRLPGYLYKILNVTLNLAMDYNFVIHTPLMLAGQAQPGSWQGSGVWI